MLEYHKIYKIIRKYGLIPLNDKAIIVAYAGEKLSDKVAKFFSPEFYILQVCEKEVAFLPLSQVSIVFSFNHDFPEEIMLSISIDLIKKIKIKTKDLNYEVKIYTNDSVIKLLVNEQGLSDTRSIGMFAKTYLKRNSWHEENLISTLNYLKTINQKFILYGGNKMKKEQKIDNIVEELGFVPIVDKRIVVTLLGENLSAKVVNTLNPTFYMLQVCENEIILIPYSTISLMIKKEIELNIPIASIKGIEVSEKGFNYEVKIETDNNLYMLSAQQKELSDFRSTGLLAYKSWTQNWHANNLDETLEYLKSIKK